VRPIEQTTARAAGQCARRAHERLLRARNGWVISGGVERGAARRWCAPGRNWLRRSEPWAAGRARRGTVSRSEAHYSPPCRQDRFTATKGLNGINTGRYGRPSFSPCGPPRVTLTASGEGAGFQEPDVINNCAANDPRLTTQPTFGLFAVVVVQHGRCGNRMKSWRTGRLDWAGTVVHAALLPYARARLVGMGERRVHVSACASSQTACATPRSALTWMLAAAVAVGRITHLAAAARVTAAARCLMSARALATQTCDDRRDSDQNRNAGNLYAGPLEQYGHAFMHRPTRNENFMQSTTSPRPLPPSSER
jgi:hypothetical protein